ncbi:ribosome assembly RNA-binding protein YhbY [Thermicanus aegyptius]|uniref:ribosome assembly RNA-binding protein YhbY n=1 Tax=Thermicanus aegyptius TaxID=94009 RepID=UPI00048F7B4D|nr:ribosome assembly RNA-binding protein YhbY [Thermicanus aegyptius]
MLTGKQKSYLRSLAHPIDPIFQVGKGGVNENLLMQLRDALEARELIKVSLLNNFSGKKEEAAEQLVKGTGAELVQLIGRTVVLYKESREKRRIELPD